MLKNKYKILLAVCCLLFAYTNAQTNLVPNPSFEVADTCPTTSDQMSRCLDWSSYGQSPDYYNTCATYSTALAPPDAAGGYQQPLYGNAYAGFITWSYTPANYREIIGTQLISTLTVGTRYYFSFFVSFGGIFDETMAADKIGLRFSTVPYSFANPAPINNFAHYYETAIITDSVNWTQIKGSYVADSAYKYIAIGCFFDDAHIDTIATGTLNQSNYYYIDNVCLSTDSNYAYTNSIQQLNRNENESIYPNPCVNKLNINCSEIPNDIEIFDLLGNQQLKVNNTLKYSDFILDTSILSNGLYLLKINYQNQSVQKQIIISK